MERRSRHSSIQSICLFRAEDFKISKMNPRMGLFQVEGFDVGKNLQFIFYNYLILVFLCKKRYFRFR